MTEPHEPYTALAFSTSFERLDHGGSRLVVATVEKGEVFSMEFGLEDTLQQLAAWAGVMGFELVERHLG